MIDIHAAIKYGVVVSANEKELPNGNIKISQLIRFKDETIYRDLEVDKEYKVLKEFNSTSPIIEPVWTPSPFDIE